MTAARSTCDRCDLPVTLHGLSAVTLNDPEQSPSLCCPRCGAQLLDFEPVRFHQDLSPEEGAEMLDRLEGLCVETERSDGNHYVSVAAVRAILGGD